MTAWQIFYRSFITQSGYKDVLTGLKNTMIIAVLGLAIGIVIGTLIAIVKVVPKEHNIFLKIMEKVCNLATAMWGCSVAPP